MAPLTPDRELPFSSTSLNLTRPLLTSLNLSVANLTPLAAPPYTRTAPPLQDYAQRARNPVLVHLLDDRLPVALLRQIWMNYSLDQALPPRNQTLGMCESRCGNGWG